MDDSSSPGNEEGLYIDGKEFEVRKLTRGVNTVESEEYTGGANPGGTNT
jgi:hypothetical protein